MGFLYIPIDEPKYEQLQATLRQDPSLCLNHEALIPEDQKEALCKAARILKLMPATAPQDANVRLCWRYSVGNPEGLCEEILDRGDGTTSIVPKMAERLVGRPWLVTGEARDVWPWVMQGWE
ncbi:uncharacterized protein KY384_003973 [Bacidia gigantensis]|uniref:uncharacterized protein n=1 Tax=Bacidia gigantensis TaxID=2732470 RepID=UPI001D036E33|nr:uncharacterized protein KY384_003973 [Bacidia gigantensis]KAG8532332.1 hypothetical protein KY384_003973 [Bacidia gigantensis]